MAERTVKANGIDIWTEDFGNPDDIPILLVMGASAQAILWEEGFIAGLVDGGRYVIRFDNRDTGQTTCFDLEQESYGLADMANDAVGVLDAYGLDSGHFVGASMGGMISQQVAIDHPDRIRSMTSIMSSPAGGEIARAIFMGETPELPPPHQKIIDVNVKYMMEPPLTREDRVQSRLESFGALAGSRAEFDVERFTAIFEREHDRAANWPAMNHHGLALMDEENRSAKLRGISTPTIVIHGTEDPILPYPHGEATVEAIEGSRMVTLDRVGHELPEVIWPQVWDEILAHTAQ
ncbi:alpha/beta fold hydrolase [Candidatus Poriferisodalis sp.]|uniref:alpha/beta fold hydrolase n=1 Tax=Candidatus Poriferisodalis sp. TaxID=3101277 RepID=UPI003B5215F8